MDKKSGKRALKKQSGKGKPAGQRGIKDLAVRGAGAKGGAISGIERLVTISQEKVNPDTTLPLK